MLETISRSVRYKVALVALAAALSALVVAGAALALYELRNYRQQWTADIATQAQILGHASAPALAFDDPKAVNENLLLLKARPRILGAAVYNARGKQVAQYRGDVPPSFAFPTLPEADGETIQGDTLYVFRRVVENDEIVGTVYLVARYELRARLTDYLGILAGVMALSLLVALLISTWLQRALTRPILAVTAAARQVIETRDFSLRVAKSTDDEIGYLVDAFNDMLAELGSRALAIEATQQSLEREIAERERADNDLRRLNDELEHRVADRTTQWEQANKELESFSYSVSHDLRAPLRSVVGFAEALIEDHAEELSDEACRKLRIVQAEGLRMGTLIDDLLAFSRLGRKALQVGALNMNALVQATWEGLASQQDTARINIHISALPSAIGDRVLLGQVWVNLLSNAVKFSANKDKPVITVSAITDDNEHVYFVRDNGAGFNPKYQNKLFGVFQRLHDSSEFAGTGVGLALVQRIVNRHGGRVWAEGVPGEGATFYFTLPKGDDDASRV